VVSFRFLHPSIRWSQTCDNQWLLLLGLVVNIVQKIMCFTPKASWIVDDADELPAGSRKLSNQTVIIIVVFVFEVSAILYCRR